MVLEWGATDRGLDDALAGFGHRCQRPRCPRQKASSSGLLGELLRAAQKAGTVRRDVDVPDVKAMVVGAQAMQAYRPDAAERLIEVVLDGLRAA